MFLPVSHHWVGVWGCCLDRHGPHSMGHLPPKPGSHPANFVLAPSLEQSGPGRCYGPPGGPQGHATPMGTGPPLPWDLVPMCGSSAPPIHVHLCHIWDPGITFPRNCGGTGLNPWGVIPPLGLSAAPPAGPQHPCQLNPTHPQDPPLTIPPTPRSGGLVLGGAEFGGCLAKTHARGHPPSRHPPTPNHSCQLGP
jgi:hypothetical protein